MAKPVRAFHIVGDQFTELEANQPDMIAQLRTESGQKGDKPAG